MGPNATAAHQQQLNEDNRQALVLFGIVVIFFVSNVPRILLNLHEVKNEGFQNQKVISSSHWFLDTTSDRKKHW